MHKVATHSHVVTKTSHDKAIAIKTKLFFVAILLFNFELLERRSSYDRLTARSRAMNG